MRASAGKAAATPSIVHSPPRPTTVSGLAEVEAALSMRRTRMAVSVPMAAIIVPT